MLRVRPSFRGDAMCGDLEARESISEFRELKMGQSIRKRVRQKQEIVKSAVFHAPELRFDTIPSFHHSSSALAKHFGVILASFLSLRSHIQSYLGTHWLQTSSNLVLIAF